MSTQSLNDNVALDRRVRNRSSLTVGNKAIYPGQGPCLICSVVTKTVDSAVVMFYQMTVLDDSGGELFVPVDKARAIGVRLLMKKSEIPPLLTHLKKRTKAADNWKQRASDNLKLLTSGSPFDLAEVVTSLTELSDTRTLTLGESGTLSKARRLLICEISEVMAETKTAAELQLDQALTARK
jgi:CarD family transcriptional regulator